VAHNQIWEICLVAQLLAKKLPEKFFLDFTRKIWRHKTFFAYRKIILSGFADLALESY
jgi:hypothetical protein